jgi:hypothetical protein
MRALLETILAITTLSLAMIPCIDEIDRWQEKTLRSFGCDSMRYIDQMQEAATAPFYERLIAETASLKERNNVIATGLQKIKDFVESDTALYQEFVNAYRDSKERLLSPYEKDESDGVDDPIVEAWRIEGLRHLYLEGLITRLQDFLKENPQFEKSLADRIRILSEPKIA